MRKTHMKAQWRKKKWWNQEKWVHAFGGKFNLISVKVKEIGDEFFQIMFWWYDMYKKEQGISEQRNIYKYTYTKNTEKNAEVSPHTL